MKKGNIVEILEIKEGTCYQEKSIASRWTEYLKEIYKGSDIEQLEKEGAR